MGRGREWPGPSEEDGAAVRREMSGRVALSYRYQPSPIPYLCGFRLTYSLEGRVEKTGVLLIDNSNRLQRRR